MEKDRLLDFILKIHLIQLTNILRFQERAF
jgi:hypothetical protein